jgi:hypothetical protein
MQTFKLECSLWLIMTSLRSSYRLCLLLLRNKTCLDLTTCERVAVFSRTLQCFAQSTRNLEDHPNLGIGYSFNYLIIQCSCYRYDDRFLHVSAFFGHPQEQT